MKKFVLLLSIVSILFISCEGPSGPPGPAGLDGADGLIGSAFEIVADFNGNDNFEYIVDIPTSIEVYESDVIMAYILVGVDNGIDIWEPLPQSLFFGQDILLYGYDYTMFDVKFFLDGTIDLYSLDPSYTNGIVFRVAVIPADFASTLDLNNMEAVIGALNINDIERIN